MRAPEMHDPPLIPASAFSMPCTSPDLVMPPNLSLRHRRLYHLFSVSGRLFLPGLLCCWFLPTLQDTPWALLPFCIPKWKWKSLSCVRLFGTPWTVHGILQARILGWVAFPFSRGSSQPRDRTQASHIVGRCFTVWATRKVFSSYKWRKILFRSPSAF